MVDIATSEVDPALRTLITKSAGLLVEGQGYPKPSNCSRMCSCVPSDFRLPLTKNMDLVNRLNTCNFLVEIKP